MSRAVPNIATPNDLADTLVAMADQAVEGLAAPELSDIAHRAARRIKADQVAIQLLKEKVAELDGSKPPVERLEAAE